MQYIKKKFNLDQDAAVEIFQLAIIILYDNVCSGKLQSIQGNIKTYLIGIARNKAYEYLRTRKTSSLDDQDYLINSYILEEEEDVKEEQLIIAENALKELGDPCKSLLNLYYYKKKSMEQIAAEMGYSNRDTAKNQKYKCLKRLQNIYFSHTSIDQRK